MIKVEIKNVSMLPDTKITAKNNNSELKSELDFAEILNKQIEDNKKLMEACQMMESFFIKEILKSAENVSYSEDTMFAQSSAEKTFKDMLNDEYSQMMSKGRGLGIAEMLYKQLKKD